VKLGQAAQGAFAGLVLAEAYGAHLLACAQGWLLANSVRPFMIIRHPFMIVPVEPFMIASTMQ